MKPQNLHAHEDRLLDFVYGELPVPEAKLVEAHLQGCARCTQALDDIRGVRATMSQLSMEPAPDAGLESLMAYAQQAARRAAAGPAPQPSRWRRWLLPVVGLASVATLGIISIQAISPELTRPDLAAAVQEPQAKVEASRAKDSEAAPAPLPKPEAAEAQAQLLGPGADSLQQEASARPAGKELARAEDWNNSGSGGGLDTRVSRTSESKAKRDVPASVGARERSGPAKKSKAYAPKMAPAEPADLDALDEESLAEARKQPTRKPSAPRESLKLGGAALADRAAEAEEAPEALAAESAPAGAVASAPAPSRDDEADDFKEAGTASTGTVAARAPASPKPVVKGEAPSAYAPPPPPAQAAPAQAAPASRKQATSVAELSRRAQEALRDGDRAREAALLRAALAAGPSEAERLRLLNRLCEAELSRGLRSEGIANCLRVVEEAPDSSEAQVARRRLSRESVNLEAPAKAAEPVK